MAVTHRGRFSGDGELHFAAKALTGVCIGLAHVHFLLEGTRADDSTPNAVNLSD